MDKRNPIEDNKMIEIFKEQLRLFKEQLHRKDMEIIEMMNGRTDIALKIKVTEDSIKMIEHPPPTTLTGQDKPQFTREWVRQYMAYRKKWDREPAQTKEIVDRFYRNETEEEKEKAIKILSVVFNNLVKSGEVSVEKKEGIKGNFYLWNGDIK